MAVMSIKESFAIRPNKESGPKVAGNVIFPDFTNRLKRSGVVGISGLVSSPEILHEPGFSNIVDFQKMVKERVYSPRKKVEKIIDQQSHLVRLRKKSRCDGVHDAEEKPCGSPRCRTKGRQKLKAVSTRIRRKRARKPDILKVNPNPLKKVA